MFGEDTMRRPPKKFSLLYLENNEMHLVSNKVSLVTDPSLQEYLYLDLESKEFFTCVLAQSFLNQIILPSHFYASNSAAECFYE